MSCLHIMQIMHINLHIIDIWFTIFCIFIITYSAYIIVVLATYMPWTNVEYFCVIDCFIFMAGSPSPKRKIRISDDHWWSNWTNNELTSKYSTNWQQLYFCQGDIPCSGRVYSYIPSLTFHSQQVLHWTKYTMPLATSCRLIKEQQVLNNPYRLSPLHYSPYKTVDSSLREAKSNVCGLLACMHVARHSLPSVAFCTLPAQRLPPLAC
jgi:hypothetical protein